MASTDLQLVQKRLGALAKSLPEVAGGFRELTKAATKGPRFTLAQKELFATALAVVQGCDGYIVYHVDAAKKLDAEREDLLELLAMAVEMGGGPAMVYASKALAAFDETE